MTPPLQPTYPENLGTIIALIIISVVLFLVAVIFIGLYISTRKELKTHEDNKLQEQRLQSLRTNTIKTQDDWGVLNDYQKLDSNDKRIIKDMLQTLNSKNSTTKN